MEQQRPYLTTTQAAERSGLSPSYMTLLLRQGKLEGFQVVRDWLIYTDSLEAFLAKPRKPGPKGPRTKA
ncbi:helix-turn-helix domain-containing protein [Dictyobacter halimunensis]|uniref:helix-turn-helix domain-containing protein n=1 Tax=Dictyobacter halimunensis TaxID=3026934 RepID=UPI003B981CD7